jgi:acyl-ACP thioesterase
MDIEFVARPRAGRVVHIERHVGLADVRPDTTVRLDALARFLQDAADEDAATSSVPMPGAWVLRRLTMRIERTPRFRADLALATWCSGVGARWAERRTDVSFGDMVCVESAGLWVYIDTATGAPARLPDGFDDEWGVSAGGRQVRATLQHDAPPAAARRAPWPLRAVDLDVMDHVNNAAYWAPVEEELARRGRPRVTAAEMEFRGGLAADDDVESIIVDDDGGFAWWGSVSGDVRASALVAFARADEA